MLTVEGKAVVVDAFVEADDAQSSLFFITCQLHKVYYAYFLDFSADIICSNVCHYVHYTIHLNGNFTFQATFVHLYTYITTNIRTFLVSIFSFQYLL